MLAIFSVIVTGVGVVIAYQFELALLQTTTPAVWMLLVGFVEEAFVRLIPLVLIFYLWSCWHGQLLSKTEGLFATVTSGLTVGGLELILKLEYLSRLEETVRFDSVVLPILFVHLPFALLAGRFAYALGEQIHGNNVIGVPSLSRRTVVLLMVGYLTLALAHIGYNLVV